jgi:hypothetical protein
MQDRVVAYWTNVDPQLGARVSAGLPRGNGTGAGRSASTAVPSSGD